MKKKCLILLVILALLLISCNVDPNSTDSNDEISKYEIDIPVELVLGGEKFIPKYLNYCPESSEIALINSDYTIQGDYSTVFKNTTSERTVFGVQEEYSRGKKEFSIFNILNEVGECPIPTNGFLVSIPTAQINSLRIRVGQLVEVKGLNDSANYEDHLKGYFYPDCDFGSGLLRQIKLKNPKVDIIQNGIYFFDSDYADCSIKIPDDSIIVLINKATTRSYRITEIYNSAAVPSGSSCLLFCGNYNRSYVNSILKVDMKLFIENLDKVSSYSDIPSVIIDGNVYEFKDKNINPDVIKDSGIYIYDDNYTGFATAKSEIDCVDVVIINDIVVYKGNKNQSIMIPLQGGKAFSFAGEYASYGDNINLGDSLDTVLIDSYQVTGYFVKIGDYLFSYDKINAIRSPEGITIYYDESFGKTTNTNIYGVEIAVSDGVVSAVETGKGNISIPEGGYVLSIHKDSDNYDNALKVKIGDKASSSLDGSNYQLTSLNVTSVNGVRSTDSLVVYQGKATTGTNEYGYEIVVENNKMVSDSYVGNSAIPENGYVISGHGKNAEAIKNCYQYGADVIFDKQSKQLYLISTPETLLNDISKSCIDFETSVNNAKSNLLYLDYDNLDAIVNNVKKYTDQAKTSFYSGEYQNFLSMSTSVKDLLFDSKYQLVESHAAENRSVWYRSSETNDNEVRATVEKLKELNINCIYIETWYNGHFLGYSDNPLIKHTTANGSYDALEGFVRICHENGIQVHAWVENFFIGTVEAQESANKELAEHFKGKWLIDSKGNDTFYYSTSNTHFIFLNPFDSEVRSFLLNFYDEMIQKYDIDGIHLDYIRFPEKNGQATFGYNDDIISAWQTASNTTADPRNISSGSLLNSWNKFRQDIISSFVKEIHNRINSQSKDIWLSAAVYPGIPSIKNDIFQDCENWVQNHYVDELFSMSYGTDTNYVAQNARQFAILTSDSCFYSTGIMAFGETSESEFSNQLINVRQNGSDGVAIFSLASITPTTYQTPVEKGAFRNQSTQVNLLNDTVIAQLNEYLVKIEKVYIPYGSLELSDANIMIDNINVILDKSKAFDRTTATVSEKVSYCEEMISILNSIKSTINDSVSYKFNKAMCKDIDNLVHWLTTSKNLLSNS